MTTMIDLGYFHKPAPSTDKDAVELTNWILFHLDRIRYECDPNDPEKTSKMLDGLDAIKAEYPEPFKQYDFSSVQNDDGTYHIVQSDDFTWLDYHKMYGCLRA